jgi:hypothetical protein
LDTGRIRDTSFVGANVPKNVGSRDAYKGFLAAKGSAVGFDSLYDSVDVLEVLPNEAANAGVLNNCLKGSVESLISRSGAFDRDIIREGLCQMRDLRTENMRDIALEYRRGVCPSHRENR